jgi:hypothetical protein
LKGKIRETSDAWSPDETLNAAMTGPSIYPMPADDEKPSIAAEDPR